MLTLKGLTSTFLNSGDLLISSGIRELMGSYAKILASKLQENLNENAVQAKLVSMPVSNNKLG